MRAARIITTALSMACSSALADWVDPGIAYRCDKSNQAFSLVSVMATSAPDDAGTVLPPSHYTRVHDTRSVQCKVGRSMVSARIRIRPAQPRGLCGGIAHVTIERLALDGQRVFAHPELFNHYCANDEALHSIEVHALEGMPRVRVCFARWDWGIGYSAVRCEARQASIAPAMATH